jgi:heme exporter protein C
MLVYWAICLLRASAGDGAAERRFAAALGVMGTINLPIIYYSVQKWSGIIHRSSARAAAWILR